MDEALKYHGILRKMNTRDQVRLIREIGTSAEETSLLLELLADPVYEFRRAAFQNLKSRGIILLESAVELCGSSNADQRYWGMQLLISFGSAASSAVEVCIRNVELPLQRLAVDALGSWKQKTSVGVLLELIATSSWQLRQDVFSALECFGDEILEPVTRVLDTDNEDLFYWGVRLLGRMGHRSRGSLAGLLKKSPPNRKFLIMSALAECGDRESLLMLVQSLSSSKITAKRASEAILRIGKRALEPLENAVKDVSADQLYWFARTLIRLGSSGQESLAQFLSDQPEDYLWESQLSLEKLGEEGLSLFELCIDSPRKEVRTFAYQCLADLELEKTYPILVRGLRDEAWVCRKLCADSLIRAGEAAMHSLRTLLTSTDPDEVYWLIYVWKRSAQGRKRIAELLRRGDKSIVSEAARSLRESVPQEAIIPLLNCLRSDSWVVRNEAAETLQTAGAAGLPKIIESLAIEDSELQFWLHKILCAYPGNIYPHLSTLLYSEDLPVSLVARAMGMIKSPSFEPHLREILNSEDPLVRLHACWALQQIHPEEEFKPIWGLLSELELRDQPLLVESIMAHPATARDVAMEGLESADPKLIRNSIFLCGRLEIHESVRKLQTIVEEDQEYAIAACEAFLHLKDRSIVPFLRRIMEKSCPKELHSKALSVLGSLSEDDVIPSILKILSKEPGESEKALYHRCVFEMGLEAIEPLIAALGGVEVGYRKAAAQLLLEFGGLAIVHLKKSQHSSDANVKYWSTKILKQYFQDEG